MTKLKSVATERTWALQNNIILAVSYGRTVPPLAAIQNFLEDVLRYFIERRDEQHEEIYKDGPPPAGWATHNRRFHGNCYLEHLGDKSGDYLPTAIWCDTLAGAYAAAINISQIMKEKESYRAEAGFAELVTALDKRNGDLDAFDLRLQRIKYARALSITTMQPAPGSITMRRFLRV